MNVLSISVSIIVMSILLILLAISLFKFFRVKIEITTKFMARTAIFAAISIILYTVPYLKFPVFFFPSFLEIHFDEVPALIAGFAYGPLSAILIIVIKTLVKLPLSSTLCVGELADLIYSLAFVIPASIIYKKHRHFIGALIALLVATVIQIAVSSIFTAFVMLDFYMFMFHMSKETLLKICQAANPNIKSLGWSYVAFVGIPFNAFKDGIVIAITIILYKRLHRLIDRI